jgi:hypothetical protein
VLRRPTEAQVVDVVPWVAIADAMQPQSQLAVDATTQLLLAVTIHVRTTVVVVDSCRA